MASLSITYHQPTQVFYPNDRILIPAALAGQILSGSIENAGKHIGWVTLMDGHEHHTLSMAPGHEVCFLLSKKGQDAVLVNTGATVLLVTWDFQSTYPDSMAS